MVHVNASALVDLSISHCPPSLRIDLDKALRKGDYELASRLQYGDIPSLEKKLAEAKQAGDSASATGSAKMLSDSVRLGTTRETHLHVRRWQSLFHLVRPH